MKKWLIAFLLVLAVTIISIYFLLPSAITVVETTAVKCPEAAVVRYLSDSSRWLKWWPKEKGSDRASLTFKGTRYHLSKIMYNAYDILLTDGKDSNTTRIILLPFGRDSVTIKWQASVLAGKSPYKKISNYFSAREKAQQLREILQRFSTYMQDPRNIYGYDLKLTTLTDTTLIATKITTPDYPDTKRIYELVGLLKNYATSNGAKITNYPMLNVRKDANGYLTMVALPLDRELKGEGDLFTKRMIIIKDNTLLLEVHGGIQTVQNAFGELGNYMQDHNYGSPAIPFESLVTDRSMEPDTSKWVTRIFAPIM